MNQKWILVILAFCQKMTSGAVEEKKEGQEVDIKCTPGEVGNLLIWFRVIDNNMEFLASFTKDGILKSPEASFPSTFSYSKIRAGTLTLKSFSKTRDSGVYSCSSLVKGNVVKFGEVTQLVEEKVVVATEAPQAAITAPNQCTTAKPCVCKKREERENIKQGETRPELFCSPIILGSMAAGSGFLLLLLIIAILYCNRIRTRRCPHHHKRRPRPVAPGKQMMTNRHV